MLSDRAVQLSISLNKINKNSGEVCLNAIFGIARVKRFRFDNLGIQFFPYYIDFGILGGDLELELGNCLASVNHRLTSGQIPVAVTDKVSMSEESSEEQTDRGTLSLAATAKDGPGAETGMEDERKSGSKAGMTIGWDDTRSLFHASGPDHRPAWRFQSSRADKCLSGYAPGGGTPPLSRLNFTGAPVSITAKFSIVPSDLHVVAVNPGSFDARRVPLMAVVRKALKKELAAKFEGDGCSVVIASHKAQA